MSPAHVLEPTYRSLKQKLLEGGWPMGHRLEAVRLADELGVSMTPVRDSLNRLAGERLVDFRTGEGYRVARLSETVLAHLFDFNCALLDLAVRACGPVPPGLALSVDTAHAVRVAQLFGAIAKFGRNAVLEEAVAALNDRLHPARGKDEQLFPDAGEELRLIASAAQDSRARLRRCIAAYHVRRRKNAGKYLRMLEQEGG